MILECPSCEAKFKIPAGAVSDTGRKVRCANCKHIWHATSADVFKPNQVSLAAAVDDVEAQQATNPVHANSADLSQTPDTEISETEDYEITVDAEDDSVDEETAHKVTADEVTNSDNVVDGEQSVAEQATDFIANIKAGLEGSDLEDDFATVDDVVDEDDFLARRRAEQRKGYAQQTEARKRRFVTMGWAALVALWISIILTFVMFKDGVISIFPAANALYASAESADYTEQFRPKEGEVLTPPITEEVTRLEAYIIPPPTLEVIDGTQTLMVRGFVENKSRRAASVPKLELQVLDNRGRVIQNWIHEPKGSIITRGAKLNFETSLSPVPQGVVRAVVKVIEGSKSSARAEYS
ncbi:zinc-ribbon domain-containing protein [Kordiimonas sp. SCSIO 12610]|uniref:zinc-ribbon domain-containing protein n=1 Tax=Kordiimonas sp. SCSIO 12610 TaxID=2829597 RepID=UPI00210916DE|nr:zinc-ribbon domain-containing protein [Kordiimonas sp. SCSIO 12610]UTW55148.1 zinc-ribbon domain-containing protein [Kordiimonas sp. SCSIO 12610]